MKLEAKRMAERAMRTMATARWTEARRELLWCFIGGLSGVRGGNEGDLL